MADAEILLKLGTKMCVMELITNYRNLISIKYEHSSFTNKIIDD